MVCQSEPIKEMNENNNNKKMVEDNILSNGKQIVIQTKRNLSLEENKELENAIKNNENDKAKEIIDIMVNINQIIIDDGMSAVFLATRYDNIEIAKYLIALGVNVNFEEENGNTPLFYARSFEIMKLLVEAGANINHFNTFGETVLSNLCFCGYLEKIKYLISVGADVNAGNGSALFRAVRAYQPIFEICKVLIEAGININYIEKSTGSTPLHKACEKIII